MRELPDQTKAALKAPQSKRFAKFEEARRARQRLDCGGFSAAFARRSVFFGTTIPA